MHINANIEVNGPVYAYTFQAQQNGLVIEEGMAMVSGFKVSASTQNLQRYISFKNQGGSGNSSITLSSAVITSAEGLATTISGSGVMDVSPLGFKLNINFNSSGKDTVTYRAFYTRM